MHLAQPAKRWAQTFADAIVRGAIVRATVSAAPPEPGVWPQASTEPPASHSSTLHRDSPAGPSTTASPSDRR